MKMDDEEIYMNLKDYVERTYEFKDGSLPNMFRIKNKTAEWYTKVYQRWAAYEILRYVKKLTEFNSVGIIEALEYIRNLFDEFACKCKKENMMFIEGFVVATDLLDMAIGYKWCY